ncbi:aminotransferase class I/II-fold pyridoxal phosphate-dependent enzyme [Corynebacterium sp. 4HC-13]|uniref:MalY/PatB family protein n=1 Tax=Corynebacterium anserum TaxID=2684406 RepID=UPI001639D290|nr:MalY/PatB family protein [Corynebacterium anserum]MBC2681133.1 aminotransferase class I/II-fold pyridoxal phosphate-dependent enzyme [Corynebacterium anserum]
MTETHSPSNSISIPPLDTLRARGTMKWTRYGEDVLPLWVAESDFSTCPVVNDAIRDAVDREYFGYRGAGFPVEEAVARFSARHYGWEIQPEWVRTVPDVVKGVAVAVEELTPPGSTVVITLPSYYPFFEVPKATNRPASFVGMIQRDKPGAEADINGAVEQEWGFDLKALEELFAHPDNPHGVGCLILCNPYNPLGRAFRAEELREVTELADKYKVRVISDEIHGPIVYGGETHIPTASVSQCAAEVTVTVTATSKGWNTAGLHCAQIIMSNPSDRAQLAHVHNLRTGEPSVLGMVASAAAYNEGEDWLSSQLDYLEENLNFLEKHIPEVLPGSCFIRPEASFLLWLDLSAVPGLEVNPAETLLKKAHVAFSEGTTFGPQGKGHVRLNFATSRNILNEACERIAAAALFA